jgi:hypothetical protein
MRFTIISAAKFEAEPIYKTNFHRLVDEYVEVGVGVLNSMFNLPPLVDRLRDRNILFVGTAGRFGEFISTELTCAAEVRWLPTGDRLNNSYSVPHHEAIKLKPITLLSHDIASVTALCGPSVSTDIPEGFAALVPDAVENIELYGVASRIAPVARSFTAILGVTNTIGPDSHIQWKENWHACATKTAEFLDLIAGELDAI